MGEKTPKFENEAWKIKTSSSARWKIDMSSTTCHWGLQTKATMIQLHTSPRMAKWKTGKASANRNNSHSFGEDTKARTLWKTVLMCVFPKLSIVLSHDSALMTLFQSSLKTYPQGIHVKCVAKQLYSSLPKTGNNQLALQRREDRQIGRSTDGYQSSNKRTQVANHEKDRGILNACTKKQVSLKKCYRLWCKILEKQTTDTKCKWLLDDSVENMILLWWIQDVLFYETHRTVEIKRNYNIKLYTVVILYWFLIESHSMLIPETGKRGVYGNDLYSLLNFL